jgi:hypothetical protein
MNVVMDMSISHYSEPLYLSYYRFPKGLPVVVIHGKGTGLAIARHQA